MRPTKTLVILQSNYIPWKGYFDLMAAADEFVIFDEVQFTRRDWRNRNKLIVNGAPQWLTIPVRAKGNYDAPIDEIEVESAAWARNHWSTIAHNYSRAPHFRVLEPVIEAAYRQAAELKLLTEINQHFLRVVADRLGISTPFVPSRSVPRTTVAPSMRLVEICKARQATAYISGPAARAYIDPAQFERACISLHYADYSGYPIYDQGTKTFEHGVSMLDVLFRCGEAARSHLKSVRDRASFLA